MSELKRYWIVVHYEIELTAETEWDACHNIRLGNRIVEEASIAAQEISFNGDLKALITQTRLTVRKEATLAIILNQLYHKLQDFSLLANGLPPEIQAQVEALSIEQLEDLSIAVLDFDSLEHLSAYLQTQND
ncbi:MULTISPECIES: DUF4351 domain-containing protein [Planktothrix]|jgi:hypothetical protein|uniref:DUF4351 domain-containing protein n=2 Tax=Planktothrix TaxID=54304 RepID=A0A479ZSK6_PLAAG|nr:MULTISPECIES: DUF4351 domain-containing protein [Planktothrix]CAD5984948.1 hypothetical protein NO108_04983 [Planktothrix rubescens]CAC5339811.1 conserved hypothetical protein [Planktothrix rubescens NIVA-CYA 18]CAD5986307.1 hypothetical protein PCC7821_05102 [Planktothrix rubescens NIVA-CYA 18]CAH2575556.1 hypothetical protein PRNO82_05031 [Planktothrix rubescens]GCL34443.1 hypothetical protein PA905_48090 [Planktothrix agardhii CCAP 1459/11A]